MNASECKERLQHERKFRRSLEEFVLDEHLISVRNHHDSLGKQYSSDLVGHHRHRIGVKVHDILMSLRVIGISVAVDTEVELLSTKKQTLIQR